MIKKLGLTNFKSWGHLEIELGPITVLFGANSSGKTGILCALLALKQTAASFDPSQSLNFGGTARDYVDLGSFRDLVFNHDDTQRIGIDVVWYPYKPDLLPYLHDDGLAEISYRVEWGLFDDSVEIEQLLYGSPDPLVRIERRKPKSYRYEIQPDFEMDGDPPVSCYAIPRQVLQQHPESSALLKLNSAFEGLMSQIVYLGPLRDHPKRTYLRTGGVPQIVGKRGGQTIEALIASERGGMREQLQLLKLVQHWMRRLGLIETLHIEAIDADQRYYEPRVKTVEGSSLDNIADVGFGVSQVLPVVTQLFLVPEDSIVLLEQPELHLHPSAQFELADLFLEVAEKRNLQLILESHSEYLLTRLQRRIAEAEKELASPSNVRLYFCQALPGGSQTSEVETNEFGEVINWPNNFFGDQVGDLDAMTQAGIRRRRESLAHE